MTTVEVITRLALMAMLALGTCMLDPGRARGHDWYPFSCCSAKDCAPASITMVPGGDTMLVSTRHGQVEVKRSHAYAVSPDAEPHACISKDRDDNLRLVCLFLPTGA